MTRDQRTFGMIVFRVALIVVLLYIALCLGRMSGEHIPIFNKPPNYVNF